MPRKKKGGGKAKAKAKGKARRQQARNNGGGGGGGAAVHRSVIRWPMIKAIDPINRSLLVDKFRLTHGVWCLSSNLSDRQRSLIKAFQVLIQKLHDNKIESAISEKGFLSLFERIYSQVMKFRKATAAKSQEEHPSDAELHVIFNEISVWMIYCLQIIAERAAAHENSDEYVAMMASRLMRAIQESMSRQQWFSSESDYHAAQLILHCMSQLDHHLVDTVLHKLLRNDEPERLEDFIRSYLGSILVKKSSDIIYAHQLLLPRFVFHLLSLQDGVSAFGMQEFINQATAVLDPDSFKGFSHDEKFRFLSLMFMTLFQTMEFADGQQELFRYVLDFNPDEALKVSLMKLIAILLAWGLEVSKGKPNSSVELSPQGFNLAEFSMQAIRSLSRGKKRTPGIVVVEKMYPLIPKLLAVFDDEAAAVPVMRALLVEAVDAIRHAWTMLSPRDAGLRLLSYARSVENAVLVPFSAQEAAAAAVYDELYRLELEREEAEFARLTAFTVGYHVSMEPTPAAAAAAGNAPDSPEAEEKIEPEIVRLLPRSAADRFVEFTRRINSIDVETGALLSDQEKMDLFFDLLADPVIQQDESVLVLLLSTMGSLPVRCLRRVIFGSLRLYPMIDDLISLLCVNVAADILEAGKNTQLKKVLARPAVANFLQDRYPHRHHSIYRQAQRFGATLAVGALRFTAEWKASFDALENGSANPLLVKYITQLRYRVIELPSDLFYCRLKVLEKYCGVVFRKRVDSGRESLGQIMARTRNEQRRRPLELRSVQRRPPRGSKRGGRGSPVLPAPNFVVISPTGERLSGANKTALLIRQVLDPSIKTDTACILVKSSQAIAADPHTDLDFLILVDALEMVGDIVSLLIAKGFSHIKSSDSGGSEVSFKSVTFRHGRVMVDLQLVAVSPGEEPFLNRVNSVLKKITPLTTNRTSFVAELGLGGDGEAQHLVFGKRFCPGDSQVKIPIAGQLTVFSEFIIVQKALVDRLLEIAPGTREADGLFRGFLSNLCLVLKEGLRLLSPLGTCKRPALDESVKQFLTVSDRLLVTKDLKNALSRNLEERLFQTRPVRLVAVYAFVQQLTDSTIIGSANTTLCLLLEIAGHREIHHLMREQAGGGVARVHDHRLLGGGGGAAAAVKAVATMSLS